ncbi:MAG: putative selenate reductase subunit YgfK [Spirochaetaceae bacterium]|jgi:putative selenate reductase|nr:putative selenate reductase subunit YgfK [Spirochaetaceae bacterium]
MSDIMRPIAFKELVYRMLREYKTSQTIFGIHKNQFYRPRKINEYQVFNESCALPLGPAAGPHTQLAQNILVSYLCGARFIELKTVQILDTLEIEKPCIDASDEGFNTEWSSEFTLDKAYDEYLKAWILLYLAEGLFSLAKRNPGDSFIFNMSVGYDLKGIKNPRVDGFIEGLKDASNHEKFNQYISELQNLLADAQLFSGTAVEDLLPSLQTLPKAISPKICSQLTLSTMHGCPPDEIEKICSYMLTEKKLDTFVKLNPTLLGYPFVSSFIEQAGFEYVELSQQAFDHDLQYSQAVPMLKRLQEQAKSQGRFFGIKMTNTLGTVNKLGRLPGNEMYMSGRLLFPLSINLASRLAGEFLGDLEISFSGGISLFNIKEVLETGIRPVTLATELLKPGGYGRMTQLAESIEGMELSTKENIDLDSLGRLAERVLTKDYVLKEKTWRGYDKIQVTGDLPMVDCYVAPCKVACPIGQDVPEYITLAAQGKYSEALDLIYQKNPLPSITGHICAHQCQYNCTRKDYEGSVEIREIKKIILQQGFDEYLKKWKKPEIGNKKAAVIGAGPAGLAAAFFLARRGVEVSVFEERDSAGGVVKYQIPDFRIPREAIEQDIRFIQDQGVKFFFNHSFDFNTHAMLDKGFDSLFIAVGADKIRSFQLEGDNTHILSSHGLIGKYNRNEQGLSLGKEVVVVGAGDTAMDAAQTALRVPGVKKVTLVYRRAERQMPCTEEEYLGAKKAGVNFLWLRNPEKFDKDGTLQLRVMELGEPDASGRRRPVATKEIETIHCDFIIPSIGEAVDLEDLCSGDIKPDPQGNLETDDNLRLKNNIYLLGDGRTGPTTIVNCMAEARRAVDAFANDLGLSQELEVHKEQKDRQTLQRLEENKGKVLEPLSADEDVSAFVQREASRCLLCNYICNKCVQVCPNRANIAIEISGFEDPQQIIHLDAYCNECGNCATFCPWQGRPYRDKFTLFYRLEDFNSSENPGFYLQEDEIYLRTIEQDKGVSNAASKKGLSTRYESRLTVGELQEAHPREWALYKNLLDDHPYLFGPVEE